MINLPKNPTPALNPVFSILLLVGICICYPIGTAHASVINLYSGASGPGLGSVVFNNLGTPNPGNDDVAGVSPNWISITEMAFSNSDIIDIVFTVGDIGLPTTEYVLTESVVNNTSEDWISYQVILGFGTGAGFVQSALLDGLGLDFPDYNSPIDFAPFTVTLPLNEDVINAVSSIVTPGSSNVFTFTIDVPIGITEFTIRQSPRAFPVSNASTIWGQVKTLFR